MSMSIRCPEGHLVPIPASKVGSTAICPHCFASFIVDIESSSSQQARKAQGRSRRSRDDDDDGDDDDEEEDGEEEDEEEERPRKKERSRNDEEGPKPRAKKSSRRGADDDEPTADEDPIEWTPRKRQLSVCSNGLVAMLVGLYLLSAFTVFTAIFIDLYELDLFGDLGAWPIGFFFWFSVPLAHLSLIALLVGMFMSLAIPGKAEAKGSLIAAMVFGFIELFIAFLALLTSLGVIIADQERQLRFVQLLQLACVICAVLCTLSLMGYLAKLMIFMKLHLESSQPITNMGFLLLSYALLLGLVYASPWLKETAGNWMKFIILLLADIITAFTIRMLVLQIYLMMRIRTTIAHYIREE